MKNKFIDELKKIVEDNAVRHNPDKKVNDILPNESMGVNLLSAKNADEMIDELVEEPLRKACKSLNKKGIETVMSSANKNNILNDGETPVEKEDIIGQQYYMDAPTFRDAGKGYAWIMINYDNLSDQNKKALFSLE